MSYREYRFWSPVLGCDASRLSMWDERGREFFMILAADDGKAYKARKTQAIEAISFAIDMRLDPGEVRIQ